MEDQHSWIPYYHPPSPLEYHDDAALTVLIENHSRRHELPGAQICPACCEFLQELHGLKFSNPKRRRKYLGRESKAAEDQDIGVEYLSDGALSLMYGTLQTHFIDSGSLAAQVSILHGIEKKELGIFAMNAASDADSSSKTDATSSFITLWIARQWLHNCCCNHDICNDSLTPRELPTRLIDLGEEKEIRPQLCVSKELSPETIYCTLSHCWGKAVVLELRQDDIGAFMENIPVNKLSRTFKEAMEICRRLGLRYIWIDSLCIVQDSQEDWAAEASRMSSVYTHSHVNIAATSSPNGQHGCFRDRKPDQHRTLLDVPHPESKFLITETYPERIFTMPTIEDGPLYQRAWVVQEAWLSPRVLHFCGGLGVPEIYWQCHEQEASEFYPEGIPPFYPKVLKQKLRQVDPENRATWTDDRSYLHYIWCGLVDMYSRAALTYSQKDRLVAVSGLAKRLGDPKYYVAGLWEPLLPAHLLWSANTAGYGRLNAPSWTWAAVDGHVSHNTEELRDMVHDLRMLEVHVDIPENGNRMGEIKEGWLHVEGTLALVKVGQASTKRSNDAWSITPLVQQSIGSNRSFPAVSCELIFDSEKPDLSSPIHILYVESRTAPDGPSKGGLILKPLHEKARFVRLGVFDVKKWGSEDEALLDWFDEVCRMSEEVVDASPELYETKVLPVPERGLPRYTLYID
ncbi:MAG: hypothetical protein Q9227_007486 [Pyrenula ochraceoflavens]